MIKGMDGNEITPSQEATNPEPEKITQNIPPIENNGRRHSKKLLIILAVFLVLIVTTLVVVFGVYNFNNPFKLFSAGNQKITETETNTVSQTNTTNVNTESSFGKFMDDDSTSTSCDNLACLTEAAETCEPIIATITYSDIPNPIVPGVVMSGTTTYELAPSTGVNNCTLTFYSPLTVFTISEQGRKDAYAEGMSDEEITLMLETMNDSMKSQLVTEMRTVCSSNSDTIVEYLTDADKENYDVSASATVSTSSTTYTTASGKKMTCTTVLP